MECSGIESQWEETVMKPFHVNSNDTVHRLTLPIQFMKFGVEDQEIVVPIRRREGVTFL